MPNFLSAAFGVGSALSSALPSISNLATGGFSTVFNNGGLRAPSGATLSPFSTVPLGGSLAGGRGTKPIALHTEYAGQSAQWDKPYSMSTDLVFYLVRADKTASVPDVGNSFNGDNSKQDQGNFNSQANSLTTTALGTNVGGFEGSRIPSNVTAGPNNLLRNVPSVIAQLGGAFKVSSLAPGISTGTVATAVGFLTNFDRNKTVPASPASTFSSASTIASSADNINNAVSAAVPTFSASGSFWDEQARSSFFGGENSPFLPSAELASELGSFSGINSSEILAQSAIDGDLLFSSPDTQFSVNPSFTEGIDLRNSFGLPSFGNISAGGDESANIPGEWYFITPPQNVSWSKESNTSEASIYGTNNPYINYGATKLRKLTLGDALVEGFSDSKAVENNILALERCMTMVLEEGSGYTAPFCWKAYAGGKLYGVFIITSVKVREQMRDKAGQATRATVDVELQEVPSYQVSSGIDLASQPATFANTSPAFNFAQKAAARAAGTSNSTSNRPPSPGTSQSNSQDNNVQKNKTPPPEAVLPTQRIPLNG